MQAMTREQLAARRHTRRRRERRRKRLLVVMASVPLAVVVVLVAALASDSGGTSPIRPEEPRSLADPVPSAALEAPRQPPNVTLATAEGVTVKLPFPREVITAVAYHPVESPAPVALKPEGGIDYEIAPRRDRPGPETSAIDVGAPAGTTVFSPVDGVVVGIAPYKVFGQDAGEEITIAPSRSAGIVVRLTHLDDPVADEPLTLGRSVRAGRTVIGRVADFAGIAEQELARFTTDRGNHLHLEIVRSGIELTP